MQNLEFSNEFCFEILVFLKQQVNYNKVISVLNLLNDLVYNSCNIEINNSWLLRRAIYKKLGEIAKIINLFYK